MKTRETSEAIIVETDASQHHGGWKGQWDSRPVVCGICAGDNRPPVPVHWANCPKHSTQTPPLPPRTPSSNLQRFDPGGRGPCVCSEAAVLDKVTGLCTACWRAFMWGGR